MLQKVNLASGLLHLRPLTMLTGNGNLHLVPNLILSLKTAALDQRVPVVPCPPVSITYKNISFRYNFESPFVPEKLVPSVFKARHCGLMATTLDASARATGYSKKATIPGDRGNHMWSVLANFPQIQKARAFHAITQGLALQHFDVVVDGRRTVPIIITSKGARIRPTELMENDLRFIIYVSTLMSSASMVVLDTPEFQQNRARLLILARIIEETAKNKQVICVTYNTDLLMAMEPTNIYVVNSADGLGRWQDCSPDIDTIQVESWFRAQCTYA